MRIQLIYPTTLDPDGNPVKYWKAFLPPLSLGLLAALTPPRHTVRLVNELVEAVDFDTPWDLVGISAMTTQADRAYEIAARFRASGVPVVMGGFHATLMQEEVSRHVDAVAVGECESIWLDILEDCEHGRLRHVYRAETRPDLSRVMAPDWRGADLSIYPRRPGAGMPMMPIYTSRGCPYDCDFCAVTKFAGTAFRTRPVSAVLEEISRTPAKEYFFVDDNIGCDADYADELFRALVPRRIRWMSQISTRIVHRPSLIDLAARSGCFYLFIGIESLNTRSLREAHKSFNHVERYEELIARMRKAGIVPFLSFIFGFDEDTPDQFEQTLRFIERNRIGFAAFWILTPLPGTTLHGRFSAEGRIRSAAWSLYDGSHAVFEPKGQSAADLEEQYWEAYQRLHTWGALMKGIWRNVRYSAHPVDEAMRNLLYQPFFQRKVLARQHPFSGGIGSRPG
jgi:radical SAM superfamily enzyme YgiQ (UPF0313 family)